MKKTILLLALVDGAGYYLHWYTFSTETSGNTEHVHIVIDKDKIKQDEAKALEKLRGEGGQLIENAGQQTSYQAPADQGQYGQNPYGQAQDGQGRYEPPRGSYAPRSNQPAVQVVEQPEPQSGYPSPGGYAPQQDPYSLPDSYAPGADAPTAPRRPARTAAQDLDRGFN
jgi:hypothetical protein